MFRQQIVIMCNSLLITSVVRVVIETTTNNGFSILSLSLQKFFFQYVSATSRAAIASRHFSAYISSKLKNILFSSFTLDLAALYHGKALNVSG